MPRSPEKFVPPKIELEGKHDKMVVELENKKRKIVNEFRKTGNEKLLNDLDNALRKLNDAELEQAKEFLRRGVISQKDYDRQEKDLGKKIAETIKRQKRRSRSIIISPKEYKEYNEIFKSVPEEIAEDEKKFIEKD